MNKLARFSVTKDFILDCDISKIIHDLGFKIISMVRSISYQQYDIVVYCEHFNEVVEGEEIPLLKINARKTKNTTRYFYEML